MHSIFDITRIINRPSVTGAVLQTGSWLSRSVSENMREFSSHTMCHVSRVTCHVSCLMCHLSPVTCHMSKCMYIIYFYFLYITKKNIILFIFKKIGQRGGASRWRVCYQWGLPCLVSSIIKKYSWLLFCWSPSFPRSLPPCEHFHWLVPALCHNHT